MKRIYSTPQMTIITISASQMIAESITISKGSSNYTDSSTNGADLVKGNSSYSVWDDDWSN